MRRKSSGRRKAAVFGIGVFIAAVGAGAFLAGRVARQPEKPDGTRVTPPHAVRMTVYPRVRIFVIRMKGGDAYLAPEIVKVRPGSNLREAALQELLKTNRWEGESRNLIPQGTRLLSLGVENGVATVNLSREFVDNFNGGARLEALTIHSIVHTLTQFQEIKKVRFLVEGEKLESLGGHLDISEPVEADSTLLLE